MSEDERRGQRKEWEAVIVEINAHIDVARINNQEEAVSALRGLLDSISREEHRKP